MAKADLPEQHECADGVSDHSECEDMNERYKREQMTTKQHVYKAINDVKKQLAKHGGITKDREAMAGGRYNFRGIDDMYNVLCGLTAEAGLCMIPRVVGSPRVEFGLTAKGGAQTHIFLDVEVDFCSEIDGSMHTGRYVGEAIDFSDKAANKAMSAAFKYAHLMVFQIPTHGESDDTENANHQAIIPQPARQVPPPGISSPIGEQNGPPPQQGDPMAAQIANGQLMPPVKATRAKKEPAAAAPPPPPPPMAPTGPELAAATAAPVPPPAPPADAPPFVESQSDAEHTDTMLGRIGEINTFTVLYAMATEADTVREEPVRTELFTAIKHRAVYLFTTARNAEEVKAGYPLVTALGQPDELKRAANVAYARFRQ